MVYAAKKGWYREDANMSVLEPQDVLRISTMLESWGDIEKAKVWIADRKLQLNSHITIDLEFDISEIEKDAAEEIAIKTDKMEKAKHAIKEKESQHKKPTKSELKALETNQKRPKKKTVRTVKQMLSISSVVVSYKALTSKRRKTSSISIFLAMSIRLNLRNRLICKKPSVISKRLCRKSQRLCSR